MAVRANVAGFVATTRRIGAAIPAAERAGVRAAGSAARVAILASARAHGAHPAEGWVSVSNRAGTRPAAVVTLRGSKAYWAERGTKAHNLAPKRKRAILTPYGPRASAHHPGARARHFWHAGVAAASEPAAAAHATAMKAALRQAAR